MVLLFLAWLLFCEKDSGPSGIFLISIIICVFVLLRMVFEWFGFIETGDEWQDWRNEPCSDCTDNSDPAAQHSDQVPPSGKPTGQTRLVKRYRKTLKERFRWASDRHYNRND
jgi:hypothetical protein